MKIYIVQTRPSSVSPDIVENIKAFYSLRDAKYWADEMEQAGKYPPHALFIDEVEYQHEHLA